MSVPRSRDIIRCAIIGSRDFPKLHLVTARMFDLDSERVTIVSGGARGVDSQAEKMARKMGFHCDIFDAEWDEHGKAAGVIRNKEMLDTVDKVIAFWNGRSKGTAHAISYALEQNIPIDVYVRPPKGE